MIPIRHALGVSECLPSLFDDTYWRYDMKLNYAIVGVAGTVLLAVTTFAYAGCPFC